jgi:hypothetical protein
MKMIIVTMLLALAAQLYANESASGVWEQEVNALWSSDVDPQALAADSNRHQAGIAEWVLALRTVYRHPEESRAHIARAALLLDSAAPLYSYGRNFLFDDELRQVALPCLLLAQKLGAAWATQRLSGYTQDELAEGARRLLELEQEVTR